MPFETPMPPPMSITDALAGAPEPTKPEKKSEADHVQLLFARIKAAQKVKAEWERNYRVDQCRSSVLGFQRSADDERDAAGDRRYQLNRIGAAFKIRIPDLWLNVPFAKVQASNAREDAPMQTVDERAQLLQDTANAIINQPQTRLVDEGLNSLKESFWAYGVLEVGYDADWIDNPLAQKPSLVKTEEEERQLAPPPQENLKADMMTLLAQVPGNERFFCRYIPAKQFLVSSNDRTNTEALDWVAYWEWMYVEDLKKTPSYFTEGLQSTGKERPGGYDEALFTVKKEDLDQEIYAGMVPVWKLWDLRTKTRHVLAEGFDHYLKQADFKYLPVFPLRLDIIPGEWYPKPIITDQLDEQDEYNDSREYLRQFRKATVPRFEYDKNALTPAELQKFENEEVGTFIGIDGGVLGRIQPIAQPSLSGDALRTIALSNTAFNEVSGVSDQQRQVSSADSATEAAILNQRSATRNSYEQRAITTWVADVIRGLLRCAIEKATLPIIVEINADQYSPAFMEDAMSIALRWKQITTENLREADSTLRWDVRVSAESMSPLSAKEEGMKWLQILQLISNPAIGSLLAISPELLKKTLELGGVRNATEQHAIADALQKKTMLTLQGMAPGPGVPGLAGMPPMGAPPPAPTPPPPVQG